MYKLIQITQVIPIFLITAYFGFYFCIDLQIYADMHGHIQIADNILVILSLVFFSIGGYKLWNNLTLRSFSAVILLNIITELGIQNYYQIYSLVVQVFLITIILATTPKFRWH